MNYQKKKRNNENCTNLKKKSDKNVQVFIIGCVNFQSAFW